MSTLSPARAATAALLRRERIAVVGYLNDALSIELLDLDEHDSDELLLLATLLRVEAELASTQRLVKKKTAKSPQRIGHETRKYLRVSISLDSCDLVKKLDLDHAEPVRELVNDDPGHWLSADPVLGCLVESTFAHGSKRHLVEMSA